MILGNIKAFAAVGAGLLMGIAAIGPAHAQEAWKLGTLMQPPALGATLDDEFAASVSKASAGKLAVERQFVGNEQEMVSQVVRGRLQMGATSAFGAGVAVPDATVVSMPYVWSSDAERRFVTDRFAMPVMKKLFAEKGLELLAIHEAGYNGVFCKMDCSNPASLKGAKARVSPAAASKMFWQSMGANGVQLPISELWPGLEQNLVVAADLPFPFYATTPGAQSAPYFVVTQHLHHPWLYFVNKAAWDKLDAATRDAIAKNLPDSNTVRDRWFAEERGKITDFVSKSGKVYNISDAQRAEWQKLVTPNLPGLIGSLGPGAQELFRAIQTGKEEFKKTKG
ncbi:TRAP transporter substrate-binding protein [Ferrovibrio sp.]|uniref:TRAP transporter substrate-binding protein n=1 Tax=Ferrovibrio sp. TaxID=1917215 RepID=UPI0035B3B9B5